MWKIHSKTPGRLTALALICAGCTLLVMLLFSALPAYQRLEWRCSDRLEIDGRTGRLPSNVIFLAIDNSSIYLDDVWEDELAKSPALQLMKKGFPWSRAVYAMVLERLTAAGAKVVAYDLRMPAPGVDDDKLREALDKYPHQIVIGSNLEKAETNQKDPASLVLPVETILPSQRGDDPRVGFYNFWSDEADGLVRRALFNTTTLEFANLPPLPDAPELWSLAAQAIRQAGLGHLIPKGHQQQMFRFVRDAHPYSLHDIFLDSLWDSATYQHGELFRDKIVLVGQYGNWNKDELETPWGLTNGPQIHLSAMSAILNQDFLHEAPAWVILLLILLGGLAAFASTWLHHPLWRTALLVGLVLLYVGMAFWLYNTNGYFLKLLSPNLALLASGGLCLVWERVLEQNERLRVRRTLERYVSKDVVKEVLDNPQSFVHTMGGVRKDITVLFSDVRGFTSLTEDADALALVTQLNEYFTEMVRIVFKHSGTLDKFIGDAVMATWGAVVDRKAADDVTRAIEAALEMLQSLRQLNVDWKQRGLPELRIGIGINHGEAICANLGSHEKQEFSVIGDAVNIGSRLEGATKVFHQDLLIGEAAAALAQGSITLRSVDLLRLSGKARALRVFTVPDLGQGKQPPPWLALHEEGVRLYRERDFAAAERAFQQAAEMQPTDWLIQEYLSRVQLFAVEPPGPTWDGIFHMAGK